MAQTTSWITATVNVNIINSSAEILASRRVIHVLCLLPTMGNRLPHRPSTRASSPDGVSQSQRKNLPSTLLLRPGYWYVEPSGGWGIFLLAGLAM